MRPQPRPICRTFDEASKLLEDAAERFRQIPDHAATASELTLKRQWRGEALWNLGRVLRDLKQPAEADRIDEERIGLWAGRPVDELVAARSGPCNSRANLIGYGKAPLSAQGTAVRELDLNLAANELRLAIARGFNDLDKLRSDPDAGALLSRLNQRYDP